MWPKNARRSSATVPIARRSYKGTISRLLAIVVLICAVLIMLSPDINFVPITADQLRQGDFTAWVEV